MLPFNSVRALAVIIIAIFLVHFNTAKPFHRIGEDSYEIYNDDQFLDNDEEKVVSESHIPPVAFYRTNLFYHLNKHLVNQQLNEWLTQEKYHLLKKRLDQGANQFLMGLKKRRQR